MTCTHHGSAIVCTADEVDPSDLHDLGIRLNTSSGREEEVRAQVRLCGGFSIGWVVDSMARACAAQRLVDRGVIATEPEQYPWTRAWFTARKDCRP